MSQKVEITVISDTISRGGRRVEYRYRDPHSLQVIVASIKERPKRSASDILSRIRGLVIADIGTSKDQIDNSSLLNKKTVVEV